MKAFVETLKLVIAALLLSSAVGGAALADDDEGDDDHERAFNAVESGRARPLAEILNSVRPHIQGEVVGVEFENFEERYVYEFKVVSPSGQLREIYVDALTAEILRVKLD
jgi:uncharacterized membrane protein YkoI